MNDTCKNKKCLYQKSIQWNTHIRCVNPMIGPQNGFGDMLSIMNRAPKGILHSMAAKKLGIAGSAHGIKEGWFNWPYNFDPTWLDNCDGFRPAEVKTLLKFHWSPDIGDESCICSSCRQVITDNEIDQGAVRMFNKDENYELRFHGDCYTHIFEEFTNPDISKYELEWGDEK